jgi:hypothetical protein
MVVFGLTSSRYLFNSDIYNLGAGLARQVTNAEFHKEHLHVSRSFNDMTTTQDVKWWVLGPLSDFIYSHPNQMPFGYNVFMGPVRIGQLRAKQIDCNHRVPPFMGENRTFHCYDGGAPEHLFSAVFEDTSDYGEYIAPGAATATKFRYDGINAHSGGEADMDAVAAQRLNYATQWSTFDNRLFPSPAFAVLLQPGHEAAEGKQALEVLMESNYIDEQTRAIFVDMALFNPMVQHVCWMRFAVEITEAGSLIVRHDFSVLHLWDRLHPQGLDNYYWALEILVMFFYAYYCFQELFQMYDEGWVYWHQWLNWCQTTNVIFYIVFMALWHGADDMLPTGFDVDGSRFVDFKPVSTLKRSAVVFTACNIFLNWFKLIAYFNILPSCRLMAATLATSAINLIGFLFVFAVMLFGFAQAHTTIFGARLYKYRTTSQSAYSLIQSLLGDFDFEEMQQAHR